MRYTDPFTGNKCQVNRYSQTTTKPSGRPQSGKPNCGKDAIRSRSRMSWEAFSDLLQRQRFAGLAASCQSTYEATLNVFERTCNPQKLGRRDDGDE